PSRLHRRPTVGPGNEVDGADGAEGCHLFPRRHPGLRTGLLQSPPGRQRRGVAPSRRHLSRPVVRVTRPLNLGVLSPRRLPRRGGGGLPRTVAPRPPPRPSSRRQLRPCPARTGPERARSPAPLRAAGVPPATAGAAPAPPGRLRARSGLAGALGTTGRW